MAFKATFKDEDFLRGQPVTPGWHPSEIINYEEKTAKTDGSMNYVFTHKIIDGPDKGKLVFNQFNEKAPGFLLSTGFLEKGLGHKVDKNKPTVELNKENTVGKKMQINVMHQDYNGTTQSKITGYGPLVMKG